MYLDIPKKIHLNPKNDFMVHKSKGRENGVHFVMVSPQPVVCEKYLHSIKWCLSVDFFSKVKTIYAHLESR